MHNAQKEGILSVRLIITVEECTCRKVYIFSLYYRINTGEDVLRTEHIQTCENKALVSL